MPRSELIQTRRGTASAWSTANPVLAAGEPGFVTDTADFKIGDGVTAWNSLKTAGNGTYAPLGDLRALGIFTPENFAAPAFGTDASTAVQAALDAAAAVNGGKGGQVYLLRPYSAKNLVWPDNVKIVGYTQGQQSGGLDPNLPLTGPCIQLLAGANTDLIKSKWFDALQTGSTLSGGISSGATSIALADASSLPTSSVSGAAPMTVVIESDVVTYTGISGNTLTGCAGVTTTHASGVAVKLQPNVYQTPSHLTSTGLVLDGNKTNNSSGRCLALFTWTHAMDDITVQNSPGDAVFSTGPGPAIGGSARWTRFRISGAGLFTRLSSAQATNGSTLAVESTAGFPSAGTLTVGFGYTVSYTGKTSTTFTGCSGGTADVLSTKTWVAVQGASAHGLNWQGPQDSHFTVGDVLNCTGSGVVEGPLGANLNFANVHVWGNGLYNWDFQCPTANHVNCQSDGTGSFSSVGSRLNVSYVSWRGGEIYGVSGKAGQTLLQVGNNDGVARTVGGCVFDTKWYYMAAPSLPLLYADAANLNVISNRFGGPTAIAGNNKAAAYGNLCVTVGSQTVGGGTTSLVVRDAITNMPTSGSLYVTNGSGGVTALIYSSFSGSTFTLTSPPALTIPGGSIVWNTTLYGTANTGYDTWEFTGADGTSAITLQLGDGIGHPTWVVNRNTQFSGGNPVVFGAGVQILGAIRNNPATKTASYTLAATDGLVYFNGTSLTATLPNPSTVTNTTYIIKNLNASTLTISGTIDGSGAVTVAQYGALIIHSNGTVWSKIAGA